AAPGADAGAGAAAPTPDAGAGAGAVAPAPDAGAAAGAVPDADEAVGTLRGPIEPVSSNGGGAAVPNGAGPVGGGPDDMAISLLAGTGAADGQIQSPIEGTYTNLDGAFLAQLNSGACVLTVETD